jgi:hypothetical protein
VLLWFCYWDVLLLPPLFSPFDKLAQVIKIVTKNFSRKIYFSIPPQKMKLLVEQVRHGKFSFFTLAFILTIIVDGK